MPTANGKGFEPNKANFRYTDLSQVSATASHLQRFGDNVGNHTDRLNSLLERTNHSAKRDRSGIGSILSNALSGAGEVFGKVGKEAGRVIKRSGDNVHATAESHRANEHDTRRSFDDIHPDAPKKNVTFGDTRDSHGNTTPVGSENPGNNQPPKVQNPPSDPPKTAAGLYHKTRPTSDNSHPLTHGYGDESKAENPKITQVSKDVANDLKKYQKEIKKKEKSSENAPSMGGATQFGTKVDGHSSMKGDTPNRHPLVKDILDELDHKIARGEIPPGHKGPGHGYCAEVGGISDYLHKNDPNGNWSPKDAQKHFDRVGGATEANRNSSGQPEAEPCPSCDYLTQKLGIHGMGSGSTSHPWHRPLNDTPENEVPAHSPPDHRAPNPSGGILKNHGGHGRR